LRLVHLFAVIIIMNADIAVARLSALLLDFDVVKYCYYILNPSSGTGSDMHAFSD